MCQNEPWGAIAAPTLVHSTRKGQPKRMHGSGELKYGQKGQRGPPFHRAEGTATSGAQGGTAKILHGRFVTLDIWDARERLYHSRPLTVISESKTPFKQNTTNKMEKLKSTAYDGTHGERSLTETFRTQQHQNT